MQTRENSGPLQNPSHYCEEVEFQAMDPWALLLNKGEMIIHYGSDWILGLNIYWYLEGLVSLLLTVVAVTKR